MGKKWLNLNPIQNIVAGVNLKGDCNADNIV